MRSLKLRTIVAASSLAAAMALPATATAGAAAQPVHSLTAATAAPLFAGAAQKVIVILRDQNVGLVPRSTRQLTAVRAEQAPIIAELRSAGTRDISATSLLNAVIATVSPSEAANLAANPAVAKVIPDGVIPGPSPVLAPVSLAPSGRTSTTAAPPCGTAASPELDPEALGNINAVQAQDLGFDGAGVTVAFLADGVDTTNPDFQRNAAYISSASPAGPVITQYQDFSGDGTAAPTAGAEAFGDASSIAAQGNQTYDLSQFVSTTHPLPSGCDIKIVGTAPGADVLALKVFAQNNDTTTSGFLQAINFAVTNGAKVINESFGSNNFPDTSLDVIREVDGAAAAAGVTVVVSSGDAGITSTIGSPSTDPSVISVGASTTFRGYEQDTFGGINDPNSNGLFADNNISDLSSGGFTQSGTTVDLVAPGDLNWALCSANTAEYADCTNDRGLPTNIQLFGGTSESAPLAAGAAADVIQAYASTHGGTDPSPALVKQILMSTATDISAPATEQGAGLLNVLAAVKEAESTAGTPTGGLLVSPNQINVVQQPRASTTEAIKVTNTGSGPVTVNLSTRALTTKVSDQSGSFCMQPGTATGPCPANTGSFQIWSGVTEVYEEQGFTVPSTTSPSRLEVAADYPFTGQNSVLHFALLEPDGTYAAYSLPQGLADFGEVEVANPPAGTWTAVFFTEKDGATTGGVGTGGTVQWDASTFVYAPAGGISPSSLTIGSGLTVTTAVTLTSPSTAGDTEQSIVLSTTLGTTTIPVTVRTLVPITRSGGNFSGVLTGGNGRAGSEAQTNTYFFDMPGGKTDLDVSVALADDPNDLLVAFLVDPNGQTVGYSTNYTTDNFGTPVATRYVNLYHLAPVAGQYSLVLDWANPVNGTELNEPFIGAIRWNQVIVSGNLPHSTSTLLKRRTTHRFKVSVENTGVAPEAFFVDPRSGGSATISLADQNGSSTNMSLPLPAGLTFPYYVVPTHTSQLAASITGSVPVTFDLEYFPGDPDVSPTVHSRHVGGSSSGDSASLTLNETEVSPGLWLLNPDEIGPYGSAGAPAATATASLKAVTQAFDTTIASSTGDFWSQANRLSSTFAPAYVPPGDSANIYIDLRPSALNGALVSGTLYIDDYALGSEFGAALPNADELGAIPFHYKVG
jgi:hypothetical protein